MNDNLVRQAQAGNQEAFSQLVLNWQRFVYSLILCYLQPGEVKDAAQIIWLTVWQKLWQLEDPAKFSAWLRQLVFYRCLNFRKGRAARNDRETTLPPETWSAVANLIADNEDLGEALEQKELRRILAKELDKLPGDYGLLLGMYYLKDMSYKQISLATALPQSTLKWRLYQARTILRGRLATILQHQNTRRFNEDD